MEEAWEIGYDDGMTDREERENCLIAVFCTVFPTWCLALITPEEEVRRKSAVADGTAFFADWSCRSCVMDTYPYTGMRGKPVSISREKSGEATVKRCTSLSGFCLLRKTKIDPRQFAITGLHWNK